MTVDDTAASTRRARRRRSDEPTDAPADTESPETVLTLEQDRGSQTDRGARAPLVDPAPGGRGNAASTPRKTPPPQRTALAWVDEASVGTMAGPITDLSIATTPFVPVDVDLLSDLPRRSPLRAGVIVPTLIGAGLVGAYTATTLLWPLYAVEPTVTAIEAQPVAAPAAAMVWPATGSAAVSVSGITGGAASTPDPFSMASITKVVTALVVLDEMPLAVGEQGPSFQFDYADSLAYWNALAQNESALDVPVGGSLSEYELLEGMLIGSAGNYAERLAGNLWPSDAVYADAANSWLRAHGVEGVTVVEPTGMDRGNTASPSALIPLAQKALANPVIAEIVAKQAVDLPGAGHVVNTNGLLADPGVLGIKTGTLDGYNLLSAKDVMIGDSTVRLYASVLGQPDDASRLAESRSLYSQLETQLQPVPSVTAGTTTGLVETAWGEEVKVVTSDDAAVILWNGAAPTVSTSYSLGDSREEGDAVGTLSVSGPLDQTTVDLTLAEDVDGPTAWWRLTHPLELFGITD